MESAKGKIARSEVKWTWARETNPTIQPETR